MIYSIFSTFLRLFIVFLLTTHLGFGGELQLLFINEDKGQFLTKLSDNIFSDDKKTDGQLSSSLYIGYAFNIEKNTKSIFAIQSDIFTPSGLNKYANTATIGDRAFSETWMLSIDTSIKDVLLDSSFYIDQIITPFVKVGYQGEEPKQNSFQNFLHGLSGKEKYNGWSDRLIFKDILIYGVDYMTRFIANIKQYSISLEPCIIYSLGMTLEYFGFGGFLRLGSKPTYDYGCSRISPLISYNILHDYKKNTNFCWFLYTGYQKRLIGSNAFLQEKTLITKIQTTDMLNVVSDKVIGANIFLNNISLNLSITHRSKEFSTQNHPQTFLKAGLSYTL